MNTSCISKFFIMLVLNLVVQFHVGAKADLIVSTSFEKPKARVPSFRKPNSRVPAYTNFQSNTGFIELKIGTEISKADKDQVGLKPIEPVLYSSRPSDRSYDSIEDYDPQGMEHLYIVTDMFLKLIQSQKIPPEIAESKTISEAWGKAKADNGMLLFKYYIGMIITAAAGILVAIAIPLVGLIFCCCRCAGKCGGGKEVVERRSDVFKRAIFGILMFLLVIVMLFGIVCAFVTNEYIEKGLKNLPSTYNTSIDDIQLYLKNTRNSVNSLLKDNYGELNLRLGDTLDRSGDIVKNRLGKATEAFAINNLTSIVSGLEKVRDQLRNVSEKTALLQGLASELQVGLSVKRQELLSLLSRCRIRQCDIIRKKYDISSLTITGDFKQLPDVTNTAREVSNLIQDNIVSEVKKGKKAFDDISLTIHREVQTIIPDLKKRISQVGQKLKLAANNITETIESVNFVPIKSDVNEMHRLYSKYGQYSIGMASVILLVTLLLTFGLFCGFCGKTPGVVYGDDSCNKGTGANFMFLAISVITVLSFFMMIVNTALFFLGGLSQQLICNPIQNLSNPEFMKIFDTVLEKEPLFSDNKNLKLSPSQALISCHQNRSIYDVLNLGMIANISDIDRYRREFKINEKLNEFLSQIKVDPNINILSNKAKLLLHRLAESNITAINFTAYNDALQEKVTLVDISELSNSLEVLAGAYFGRGNFPSQLKIRAIELQAYQPKYVTRIKSVLSSLRVDVENLQRDIKFNQSSFKEAIHYLINTVEKAQNYIHNNGRQEIDALANSFVTEFSSTIDSYASHLQDKVGNDIGNCWPVSQAINSSVSATCKSVIYPFNGFWISVGWCLILWLPVLLIAVVLSILYKRTDPYTNTLVESETFDSYLDRDNIPLANVEKKRRHKRRRPDRESYENRSGYVPDYSPMSDYVNDRSSERRRRPRSNGYMPAPTSSEDTTPNTPRDFGLGIISSQSISTPPEYLEKPPPYYYHNH
ncbi:Prominin-1-A [Nymphon striatum]|nr:Prominin-1-A [Nymphon striatum]